MSDIFSKGDYRPIEYTFRCEGIAALEELSTFQDKYKLHDTDTLINEIRDSLLLHII